MYLPESDLALIYSQFSSFTAQCYPVSAADRPPADEVYMFNRQAGAETFMSPLSEIKPLYPTQLSSFWGQAAIAGSAWLFGL